MARLILSNLCLSFNILLLNTVLCKTPSTFISSRDLIKPVCSVPRIAKPFEPYFVCLLPEALKYCVCEPALGSHAFTLKVLRDPFRHCAFCFQWDTCLHKRGYCHCALHWISVYSLRMPWTQLWEGGAEIPTLLLLWLTWNTCFPQKWEDAWKWHSLLLLVPGWELSFLFWSHSSGSSPEDQFCFTEVHANEFLVSRKRTVE